MAELVQAARIRRALTEVAHCLAAARSEIAYWRPFYFIALYGALDSDIAASVRATIMDELSVAVAPWLKGAGRPGDRELLWEAFGKERVDLTAYFRARSSAYRAFERTLKSSGLPESVIDTAWELYRDPSSVTPRTLTVTVLQPSQRLRTNPLSPGDELIALAEWKLERRSPNIDLLRNWVVDMIYNQVGFHIGREWGANQDDVEDVAQEVLSAVLQQLRVYQPRKNLRLERWVFSAAFYQIRTTLRSLRRWKLVEVPATSAECGAVASVSEEAAARESELVEYALTRIEGKSRTPDLGARIQMFAAMLGPLTGTGPAKNAAELKAQLQVFFPGITEAQLKTFLEKSGIGIKTARSEDGAEE